MGDLKMKTSENQQIISDFVEKCGGYVCVDGSR